MCLHTILCYLTKNKHTKCHKSHSADVQGTVPPSFDRLTDPAAIQAYEKALKATLIYKNAESYCCVSNFERFDNIG